MMCKFMAWLKRGSNKFEWMQGESPAGIRGPRTNNLRGRGGYRSHSGHVRGRGTTALPSPGRIKTRPLLNSTVDTRGIEMRD